MKRKKKKKQEEGKNTHTHAGVAEESLTWTLKEKVEENETVGTAAVGLGEPESQPERGTGFVNPSTSGFY